jgi:ATP-dependent Lon protease
MDSQVAQTTVPVPTDSIEDALLTEVKTLRDKLGTVKLPDEMRVKANMVLDRLERNVRLRSYGEEFEKTSHYIEWITTLPWEQRTQDNLDLVHAKEILDKHHYGLNDVKERILQFVSILNLKTQKNPDGNIKAPILLLVGLVGTGKTTFAYSLAEALGRKIVRIPFGGMGSARDLRGQSRLHIESEPGAVIKGLRQSGVKNPIMLLDEIDRVTEDARMDIMGVLVELLDPSQNYAFVDHYIDYPVDLSEVLFIATANNTRGLATAVMDRLEQLDMPSYSDEEKIHIAREYLLPRALEESGLDVGSLIVDEAVWPNVVRPLGFDSGIRTLQRTIKNMCGKVAKEIVEKKVSTVQVTADNVKFYLPQY